MFYLIASTLIGVNIFPILVNNINVWNAQGFFIQGMVLLMFCWSFKEQAINKVRNEPLGWFLLWCGASVLIADFQTMIANGYVLPRTFKAEIVPYQFLTFFNVLCVVLIFKVFSEYLTREKVIKILDVLRYIVIANIIICALQYFNLCEFFSLLYKESTTSKEFFNNLSGGMVFQPTVMASIFGLSIPLFMYKNSRLSKLCIIFIVIFLCFMSGTSKGDISSGGIVTAVASTLFYLFFRERKLFWIISGALLTVSCGIWYVVSPQQKKTLLDLNGRQEFWVYYIDVFKQSPFLGKGLGYVRATFVNTPFPRTMQLHNEFLQTAVELGLLGLAAFVNIIMGVFKLLDRDDAEMLTLHAILFGFVVSCLHVHLGHIWYSALIGVLCYAGIYALESEKHECCN